MKIIRIFGGGIGGLTVAHQLSFLPDVEIHLYESTNVLGGLARSSRDSKNHPIELCWRVFFGFYNNFLKLIKEIPGTQTIFTKYKHFNVSSSPLDLETYISGLYNTFYGFTSCDERLIDMDKQKISWYSALKNIDPSGQEQDIFKDVGPWLGMDRYKASFMSVIKVGMEMQIIPACLEPGYKDFVTTEPTSEAIFDKWYEYLKTKVHFHFNTSLIGLQGNNKIEKAIISSSGTKSPGTFGSGGETAVTADYFVLSVPVQVLAKIIDKGPKPLYNELYNTKELAKTCLHMQPCFQLYFKEKVNLGDKNAFLMVDSPWDLIILSYDSIYNPKIDSMPDLDPADRFPAKAGNLNLGDGAKGGWSIAACTIYRPGLVYNKPMTECSEKEIKEELLSQLFSSKELKDIIKKYNNFSIPEILGWGEIWPTYKTLPLRSSEPKFTNNAGSYDLRPSYKTSYSNLFIATAYIKETIDIFSMEAACIAGKHVANTIDSRCDSPIMINRPWLFLPFRLIDKVCYWLGLPNLNLVLLFIIILVLIFFLIIRFF